MRRLIMNKYRLQFFLTVLSLGLNFTIGFAQNGLERVIVEEYYSTTDEDTIQGATFGLKEKMTTYRVYLDLLPNYSFQAAYGSPEHLLFIRSTSDFYNQTYLGNSIPNAIPSRTLNQNLVMIDSWLSAGTAGESYMAVPLEKDSYPSKIEHTKYLRAFNNAPDGMAEHPNPPRTILYAIEEGAKVFHDKKGNEFKTDNGAWACLGKGAKGIDSTGENHVLIGQFTTAGDFSFELNVQLGKPDGKVQNFVAKNPINQEIVSTYLIYNSANTNHSRKSKKRQNSN